MNELAVIIEGVLAGSVRRSAGKVTFAYDDDYAKRRRATPLSTSVPIGTTGHEDAVIAPWIAGLLPDNDDVIRRWARELGVRPNAFDLLATRIGEDCAGAVQFTRLDDVDDLINRPGSVEWLDEADIASLLRELGTDHTSWRGDNGAGHFSLAGAQAKTALLLDGGRWGIPTGAIPTTHIVKPAITGFDDHDLNEHLCLLAARKAGLLAARSSIQTFGDQRAIVIERYDRIRSGGIDTLLRIHQEDFCQALSVDPSLKYEADGGPGVSQMLQHLHAAVPPSEAASASVRILDAVIWNWLIGGTDAHAKNYSLLLTADQVRLAPFYDIASMLPYQHSHIKKLRLAMRIGGSYQLSLDHNPWPRASKMWGVDYDELRARIVALAEIVGDTFRDASTESTAPDLDTRMPLLLTDCVAERASSVTRLMHLSASQALPMEPPEPDLGLTL